MRKIALSDVMDQRTLVSHVSYLVFSTVVTLGTVLAGKMEGSFSNSASAFVLIFLQLEVFIYFGNKLFAELNFDRSPSEITRIVLFRFTIFLASCLLAAMILFVTLQYLVRYLTGEELSGVLYNFIHVGFKEWFRSTIAGLSGGALIFIVLLWQSSLRREQKLREENLIFQNETLKNQVNPHFLFNSLNTLSSLIITNPDVAERFIIRLSSIYRYILENSHKDKVPLASELEFISEYYSLHKVRDEEKILLNVNTPGADNFEILPVSLQILVENAIKHNIATRENPLVISIYIEENKIVVTNNLQRMSVPSKSTKIGLKNLAERVKLLTSHSLIIEETSYDFTVKVPMLR
jgi:hypothetical protein